MNQAYKVEDAPEDIFLCLDCALSEKQQMDAPIDVWQDGVILTEILEYETELEKCQRCSYLLQVSEKTIEDS